MIEIICRYQGDRDQTLIAYLYDDIDPGERTAFESHLDGCARCRSDLDALGGVRAQLARWAPPEASFVLGRRSSVDKGSHQPVWRELRSWPAWAQVAAAMLVLGVSAGVANLDLRYDHSGLSVRTGWSKRASPAPSSSVFTGATGAAGAIGTRQVTRSDLTDLEQQLRNELHAVQIATAHTARSTSNDAELMRRLKALIDESERRQQRELALRVGEVVREVNSQRQADLRKIDQNIGLVQNRTGVEVLRQREMLNYLVQRVAQRQ